MMHFSKIIIRWYHINKRDLPWRHTQDPYKIWLSEIILQQTRVLQGLPYYITFIKKFPAIQDLAKAKEGLVLKTWQGLGYYSRARNLHHTAKFISKEMGGVFPNEFEFIKKLKGVGDYTAAAIASFAFNKPHAVVDGNVYRVLARYFGIKTAIDSGAGKIEFAKKANALIDKKNPGIFNQAIMEFGALQCVPQNPDCNKCPLKSGCVAFKKNWVEKLPVKESRTKVRVRHINYFVVRSSNNVLIKKRVGNDIWKNMYDFPLIESKKALTIKNISKLIGMKEEELALEFATTHILSHQKIVAKFWGGKLPASKIKKITPNAFFSSKKSLSKYPLPKLIENYFSKIKNTTKKNEKLVVISE